MCAFDCLFLCLIPYLRSEAITASVFFFFLTAVLGLSNTDMLEVMQGSEKPDKVASLRRWQLAHQNFSLDSASYDEPGNHYTVPKKITGSATGNGCGMPYHSSL